jgi:ribosomal protein S18 acetylase RimI-like enzyme
MKITQLNAETEPLFWQHIHANVPDHYFFILDVKYDAPNSKVTLALDEKGKIAGIMLVYHDAMAQLRGSNEAIKTLLAQLDLDKIMITTPIEYVPFKLPSRYTVKEEPRRLTVMALRKGEETPQIRHDLVRLFANDAEDIAALMRACNFGWWGEINTQQIAERMKERLWLGIKTDGKLVSIGGTRIDDWASNINTVATHEDYRGRGYATSIVSALAEQILKKSNLALIHVETTNTPAIRAYTKVGFKQYKNYMVTKAEKI